ncbi:ABC transporter ATP-binding protein [Calidifontibacter sp. DB0510]|uniref:ABC transporter ATP-binding protein n=1 Tax=Metallococcus carri TaxID=1656884 RepID=A0A967B261_9MICO|nr:ABC transporter ATP-binding protein [Metallococcus carri]NHN56604.1 ABC transporter ATP-binding protein [Metallococcus carri]NOP38903.1 ABC transporter ATP-binding protein [Calidifontibacter sp. DB2511S]
MSPTSVTASDLQLAHGRTDVVRGAGLDLRPGEVTALVGPNGSGKSTLLRGIARLHPLSGGTVQFVADDGSTDAADLSSREVARRIAMLCQQRPVPAGVTVRDAVGFGRYPHRQRFTGRDDDGAAAVDRALATCGLTELADRAVDALSGGQVQRVWLAACLAQDTPVLLLDEPTNHLDLRHQVAVLELLRALATDGAAVGVVLHDLNHAAAIADRVVLLVDGEVVADGTPAQVLTAGRLSDAFGVPVSTGHTADGRLRVDAFGHLRALTATA